MNSVSTLDLLQATIDALKHKTPLSEELNEILGNAITFSKECESTVEAKIDSMKNPSVEGEDILGLREQQERIERLKEMAIEAINNEESPTQLIEMIKNHIRSNLLQMESWENGGYDARGLPLKGKKLVRKMEGIKFV